MMSFFDKVWQKLFGRQFKYPSSEPLVAEALLRTQPQKSEYFQWLQHGAGQEIQDQVYHAYTQKLLGQAEEYAVHLLQMPYANGFALTYPPSLSPDSFRSFFDWLKDRILVQDNYRLVNAERQFYDRGKYVEIKEKYYLKPHITSEDHPPFNQYYGNILIEHIVIDNTPSYIKLVANVYSDRMYTKATDFKHLMNDIFTMTM